jgi:glycosyltransferase involved in cell wall biosynthesis
MIKTVKGRRVLLVTNALPPTMLADSQRARLLAYKLPPVGWDIELVAPDADFQIPTYLDQKSVPLLPRGIPIHEVSPGYKWLFRVLKMRSVAWRGLWPMYQRGIELLKQRKFDLVYISTAQFNFFCLGALWYKKTGVPYVLDFHDPWVVEKIRHETSPYNWKHHISVRLTKYLEYFAMKHAAGLVAVSPVYLEQLRRRYPHFRCVQPERTATIPFGADERDLVVARQPTPTSGYRSAVLDIVYVGAGRSIMAKSFRRICRGLARLKLSASGLIANIKIRLRGTYAYWQPGDPTELQSLAQAEGVGEMVEEQPARIGYVDAVRMALDAAGLLVLGVDDPAYMPSKLFLYALTGKPLLACLHARSQVNDYFQCFPELGTLIHFDGPAAAEAVEDALLHEFLQQVAAQQTFPRETVRAEFSADAMARRHADLFEKCLTKETLKC